MSGRRLALVGAGKMGRAVAQLAAERGWAVVARIGADGNRGGAAITPASLDGADVAVEFTRPDAAADNVLACVAAGCPVVVGTTGWYDELARVSAIVNERGGALLWAANFAVGVHVFERLVAEAARLISAAPAFDAHLVETHHAAKKDSPSGTARQLSSAASAALGREVPVTSVRTGHVPGTHELIFDAPFEQIRLTHTARDRRAFADGALTAAEWLRGRRGVFTMADVLGEEGSGDG